MTDAAFLEQSKTAGIRSRTAGFLLVEALATMAISALLLIALGSLMSLMLRASDRTERNSSNVEEFTRTVSALTREIKQASPIRWAGANAGFVFSGTDRDLLFARNLVLPNSSDRIDLVTLKSEGRLLTRQVGELPPGATSVADVAFPAGRDLVQNRFEIRFAYFGRLADGRETLSDTWATPEQMPTAVRVSLLDSNGAVRASLRAPLFIGAEPGCAAPRKAVCSFVRKSEPAAEEEIVPDKPVDPDDAMGWMRYVRP